MAAKTAIEAFAIKTEIPSWARTMQWETVPEAIRRRAFFSAAVGDAQALSTGRQAVAKLLAGASQDGKLYRRDIAVRELQAMMRERGLDTGDPDALTNPAAERRAALVLDINRAQAQGYARFRRSSSGGALLAFPCQELVRVREVVEPRDWPHRWAAAGGDFVGPERRMIARKTDPLWEAISRFGTPYPPFDFNSGMGLRDISRREAAELGVIGADYVAERDPVADFNATVQADVTGVQPELLGQLIALFGDAVEIVEGIMRFVQ
jgi:hypothetical protein